MAFLDDTGLGRLWQHITAKLASKANQTDLDIHTSDTTTHITADERTAWNAAESNANSYTDEAVSTKADKTMIVTITGNETDGYTMDKSCDEIRTAYVNGQTVIAKKGANLFTMSACSSSANGVIIFEQVHAEFIKAFEIYTDYDITYYEYALNEFAPKTMVVTVTGNNADGFTADKEPLEIYNAFTAGANVYAIYNTNPIVYYPKTISSTGCTFIGSGIIEDDDTGAISTRTVELAVFIGKTATRTLHNSLDEHYPVMVNITGNETDGYTSDKTIDEIMAAYIKGNPIEVWYNSDCHTLAAVHGMHWLFTSAYQAGVNPATLSIVDISTTGAITIKKHTLATSEDTATITEQLATKSEKLLYIVVSGSGDNITADKTYTEIAAAFNSDIPILAGFRVREISNYLVFTLNAQITTVGGDFVFTSTYENMVHNLKFKNDNTINYSSYELATTEFVQTAVSTKVTKTSLTLTLPAASWTSNSITVTATGATVDNTIFVAPAPASQNDYTAAGVMCTEQAANSLTFTCTSVPTADLSVNIVIFD